MKEIKFRAWDAVGTQVYTGPTDSRRMSFYGSDFTMDDSQNTLCFMTPEDKNPPIGDYGSMIRYTLMQYTGLKDKNGKEIYEGDVVCIENFEREFKNMERPANFNIFVIVHNRCTFAFDNENDYMPLTDYDRRTLEPYSIKVIGNIYENPELVPTTERLS